MSDRVECPYCGYDNDMSDGLVDLPSDNTFDHECEACEKEFEIEVEFEPLYRASEINYVSCEKCNKEERDIHVRGKVYPFPKSIKENNVCRECFLEGHRIDFDEDSIR